MIPTVLANSAETFPLAFEWGEIEPVMTEQFPDYRASILRQMSEDNILEITGHYYQNEGNSNNFENLGMDRAYAIRGLFHGILPLERIRLKSKDMGLGADTLGHPFPSASFGWYLPNMMSTELIELEDKTILFYGYQNKENWAPEIHAYLVSLAARLKATGETAHLTGHTNQLGNQEFCYRLGSRRAKNVRDILVNLLVEKDRIRTYSKGAKEPIATNKTEEGQHQNRRVVITISNQ